jgi:mRNA interferase MazF
MQIEIKKGMVLLINLDPTMGSETGKSRPCIVVTNNIYNSKLPVIQVVPITAWSEKNPKLYQT